MFQSLRMKLMVIFFILILSVMLILNTFLLNGITRFYFTEFNTQVSSVFTQEVLSTLEQTLQKKTPNDANMILNAFSASLGIDNNRAYYILNQNGDIVLSSNDHVSTNLEFTPNIALALNGDLGLKHMISSDYLDIAIPIDEYVIYVRDNKAELTEMTELLLKIALQAIFIGIIASIILSLFLSKTMTKPIENLTKRAKHISEGDFKDQLEVISNDEIGVLTQTFNQMSDMLNNTLNKVQEEKNKLSTLFLHMTDGVLAFEPNGTIINMNLKAEQMLNIKFHQKLHFSDIFKGIALPEYEGEDAHYAETLYHVNDKMYRVLFAPLAVYDSVESGILIVVYDVTESTKLENARREFVANVSHELRTPLTNIKSYTETILENRDYLDEETESKFLGIIANETDRMTLIVKDLLTLSKLDHGSMEVRFEKVDFKVILKHVYEAMKLEAEKCNIRLHIVISNDLSAVYGDKGRLEQVIVNIVSNALKYTLPNKSVTLTATNDNDTVFITIKDQGYGIPKEDLPYIFDRFYRVDKARSREKGGTGLGLAIAKNIIELHGGTITLESEVDKGTIVAIRLPIESENNDAKTL